VLRRAPTIPPRLAFRRRKWTEEEQCWIDSETFPSVVVRSYTKEKHRRRDAVRLAALGYMVAYKTFQWEAAGRWYVTYKQHRSVSGRRDSTPLMG
jgi:hypothetical protein